MKSESKTKNYPEFRAVLESSDFPEVVRENLKLILGKKLKDIPKDSAFSMLDVGSSDGEMSLPLAQWIKGNFDNFRYTAIEPEDPAFKKLNERIQHESITYTESHNFTIDQYLNTKKKEKEMFDFILFSHVFYHIPKEKWDEVIMDSQRLLKPNGFIIVVLDSLEGQAYELLDLVTENKTRVDTLEFGDLCYAEDMEDFLKKKGIEYSEDKFPVHIFVSEGEQKLLNFARLLGFLYRTFPEKILANYSDELREFLERIKRGDKYILEDINKAIAFGKD